MDKNLFDFITDLITELQEKYDTSLVETQNESESDKCFRLGSNIAYYDTLDLIESQLKSFEYDINNLGKITPVLGKKSSK